MYDTIQTVIATLRITQLAKMVQNLFLILEKVINNIISTLKKAQQTYLNSVAKVIMDNHITFGFLSTTQEDFML